MKKIFLDAYEEYLDHMRIYIDNYDEHVGHNIRRKQCLSLISAIDDSFNFDEIIVLETGSSSSYYDGLFGLFLGYVAQKKDGIMMSVDISPEAVENSKIIFNNALPKLPYYAEVNDSIEYLKKIEKIPNLVHLDSWDFNLFNPMPSALHGWEEFKHIESKMSKGSIIIVDDNYKQGTYVQWFFEDGQENHMTVPYPMVGKGANIYQYVLAGNSDWELIGSHYDTYDNIKIIIQKK